MRSPGDTVEVDFSLDPTMVPSLETSVLVDVDCFKELGVMVEVEDDLDLSGVRWLSLSSTGPYDQLHPAMRDFSFQEASIKENLGTRRQQTYA